MIGEPRSEHRRSLRWLLALVAMSAAILLLASHADAAVYWTNSGNGTIGRAESDGSSVDQSFISGLGSVGSVAVGGGYIYWTSPSKHAIGRAKIDGSDVEPEIFKGLAGEPYGLAFYDEQVYVTQPGLGLIGRYGENSSGGLEEDEVLIEGLEAPLAITVDSSGIYWTEQEEVGEDEFEGQIGTASLTGEEVSALPPSDATNFTGITHGSQGFFYSLSGYGAINSTNVEATSWGPAVEEISGPGGLALDAEYPAEPEYLYYAAAGGNEIGRYELGEETPEPEFITGADEPLDVAVTPEPIVLAQPTIALNTTTGVRVGEGIHATAELSGGNQVSGTVVFELYEPDEASCSEAPVEEWEESVSGGVAETPDFTASEEGTYHWTARYGGDARNEEAVSECQATSVVAAAKAQPTITAEGSAATTIGGTIHGVAHLSGSASPTGELVFGVWGPGNESCVDVPLEEFDVALTGDGEYTSPDFTATEKGTYHWEAFYGGDENNEPSASSCAEGAVTVSKATPTTTSVASPSVVLGGTIHDTVTLSGGYQPTGSLYIAVWGPGQEVCEDTPLEEFEVTVTGNREYISPDYTPTVAGTYAWANYYEGDPDNETTTGGCAESTSRVVVTAAVVPGGGGSGSGGSSTSSGGSSTAPTTPAPTVTSPTPLRLVKVLRNKSRGVGSARFSVPAAGTLTITGRGVKTRSLKTSGAGVGKVRLQPKGAYLKRLKTNHRGFTWIKATFRPAGGGPVIVQKRRVRLVLR